MKKQLSFFKNRKRFFGGQLLHGKRRSQRPLSSGEALHIVLRSSWAKGSNSFLSKRNKTPIEQLIQGIARKYQVRVYKKAIVGNHIHLIIKFSARKNYLNFIRVLSGKIAEHVMQKQSFKTFKSRWGDGCHDYEVQGLGQAFWQFRPFTRILYWGGDFKRCCEYVNQNQLEAIGFIPYRSRKSRYASLLKIINNTWDHSTA